jgi:hypothetical protein
MRRGLRKNRATGEMACPFSLVLCRSTYSAGRLLTAQHAFDRQGAGMLTVEEVGRVLFPAGGRLPMVDSCTRSNDRLNCTIHDGPRGVMEKVSRGPHTTPSRQPGVSGPGELGQGSISTGTSTLQRLACASRSI